MSDIPESCRATTWTYFRICTRRWFGCRAHIPARLNLPGYPPVRSKKPPTPWANLLSRTRNLGAELVPIQIENAGSEKQVRTAQKLTSRNCRLQVRTEPYGQLQRPNIYPTTCVAPSYGAA